MKSGKKLLGIVLAILLLFSLNVTAFAADLSAHNYTAYQIFTGTQGTGSANLAVSGWGSGIDGTNFLAALQASDQFGTPNPFASCESAADVATAMASWRDSSNTANAFAKLAYQFKTSTGTACENGTTLLQAGYYLVVDSTNPLSGTGTVRNLALLQLTQKDTFVIASKVEVPSVIKKVKDINDTTETTMTGWQDSADWDIGDKIPFKLEATLPSDLANYPSYKLVFHDTECAGLTFDAASVKVYIGNSDTALAAGKYTVATTGLADNETFTVTVDDVISLGGTASSKVRVEYEATLNNSANIGSLGNPNEVYLEYSNNPNFSNSVSVTVEETDYTVKLENGDLKVYQVSTEGGSTEVTDESTKNTVLDAADDISGSPNGSESKETGKTVIDKVIVFTYQFTANKTDGTNALPGADFALYKFIPSTDGADSLGEENDAVAGTWTLLDSKKAATPAESPTTFSWVGIDDGTYKLVESTVPSGYTGMKDQIFTVTAAHDEASDNPALTSLSGNAATGMVIEIARDEAAGKNDALTTTVVNKAGSTLPETGGRGTTIFYAVGGVLLLGAAVLLITKKRMNAKG